MKKLIVVFVSILILSSCDDSLKENLVVTGKIKGLKKGMLYLQHVPDSILISVDSVAINGDGNFILKTYLESPEVFYLYLDKKDNNDINDRITFFAEPGTVTINTDWNTFDTTAKISGSKSNEVFEEYQKIMSSINKRNFEIMLKASQANNDLKNQASIDSLQNLSNKNTQRGYAFAINFALNHKDSYVAPYIALKEIPDANKRYLDSIYSELTPEVTSSKYGKELAVLLNKN